MARAPTTSPVAAKKTPAKKLPAELVRNAKAKHDARIALLVAKGQKAIALVTERRQDIASNFLDVADALQVLRSDGVPEALGRASFVEVCALDLDMALSKANRLIALAERMTRGLVLELGQERASAILDLVDATPADDSPEHVFSAKVTLPSGEILDVGAASTHAIREGAAELRRARPGRGPGRTVTAEEQATLAEMLERVRAVPALSGVRARLIAMGAAHGADIEVRVPLAAFAQLVKTLAKKG